MATGESGRALLVFAVLVVAVFGSACAQRFGKQSAKGMVAGLEGQTDPNKQLMRVGATRAVEGAVAAFDAPEQREQIRSLVSEMMSAAVQTAVEDATRQLVTELGPDGDGRLTASLSNAGSRFAAGVVNGARGEMMSMFPDCSGLDQRGCIERQLQQMARSTAAGFTKGVRESLGLPALFLAFVMGVAGGVLGTWLMTRRPQRRVLRTV
jgi:hypothetical protein